MKALDSFSFGSQGDSYHCSFGLSFYRPIPIEIKVLKTSIVRTKFNGKENVVNKRFLFMEML